jgi:hypothetical protein
MPGAARAADRTTPDLGILQPLHPLHKTQPVEGSISEGEARAHCTDATAPRAMRVYRCNTG